jgi:hypothetical protein
LVTKPEIREEIKEVLSKYGSLSIEEIISNMKTRLPRTTLNYHLTQLLREGSVVEIPKFIEKNVNGRIEKKPVKAYKLLPVPFSDNRIKTIVENLFSKDKDVKKASLDEVTKLACNPIKIEKFKIQDELLKLLKTE